MNIFLKGASKIELSSVPITGIDLSWQGKYGLTKRLGLME